MAPDLEELPEPELVEIERRSVAMLAPGQWALRRERAAELLEQLAWALRELRRLRQRLERPRHQTSASESLRRLAVADTDDVADLVAASRAAGAGEAVIDAVLRGRQGPHRGRVR